jgi:hypothetical protein
VSRPDGHPYWRSDAFRRHLDLAFDEWLRRMLTSARNDAPGPDETVRGGGFGDWIAPTVRAIFGRSIPLVAYEGGPSLYTNEMDHGGEADDGITRFVVEMNRHPRFETVYRTHLERGRANGLVSHMPYVDAGAWSKFGQWGHLEHLSQDPEASPKYRTLLEWFDARRAAPETDGDGRPSTITWEGPFDRSLAAEDAFSTTLRAREASGSPVKVRLISAVLAEGVTAEVREREVRVRGTAGVNETSYLFVRADAEQGEARRRIYSIGPARR